MSRHVSRHNGVSCDACGKGGFSGKRYKCLVCYDFDLCADCYEGGETGTGRHSSLHPVQCILTRVDADFFYGSESHSADQPQSFTCPLCGGVGLSEAGLREHVTKQHGESNSVQEVICPVCAAHPSGDPNHLTDDLPTHLTVEHRALRDMDSAESNAVQSRVRRLIGRRRAGLDRYIGALSREPSQQQDSVDPITELLSQLSGPGGGGGAGSGAGRRLVSDVPPHIQQLLEQDRQAFDRGSPVRRPVYRKIVTSGGGPDGLTATYLIPGEGGSPSLYPPLPRGAELSRSVTLEGAREGKEKKRDHAPSRDRRLLANYSPPKLDAADQERLKRTRADRSLFVQELLLATLASSDSSSSSSSSDASEQEDT